MLTETPATSATYRRDLGDGLVLRWSTAEDTENIAQLAAFVFREKEDEPLNEHMIHVVRRLMRGDHPFMGPGDYGVVEDTRREGNPIVACTCLYQHTWYYEDIAFPLGRPEIVATHPDYRKRGLIRALFEMVHARSEARGDMVQAITGINYFYRQFGYEYALDLGGGRAMYLLDVPKAKEEPAQAKKDAAESIEARPEVVEDAPKPEVKPEAYTLRAATVEDIPQIMEIYRQRRADSIVWYDADEAFWRYELQEGRANPEQETVATLAVIVDASGATCGYVYGASKRWWRRYGIWALDTAPNVSLIELVPSLLRAIQTLGAQVPTAKSDTEAFSQIGFNLGRSHPIYEALGSHLAPVVDPPYAWYVRVPDVPAFLRRITPVLEKRLAGSIAAGYSGELKIDQFRGGLRMVFEKGKLTTIESWPVPTYNSNASAGIPQLLMLKLIFGYQSLKELKAAFPDIWTNNDAKVLLNAFFPARPSFVMG